MPYADAEKRREYNKEYQRKRYLREKILSKKCNYCGAEYLTKYESQRFCSIKCAGNQRANYVNCMACGKDIQVPPSVTNRVKYCSKSCRESKKVKKIDIPCMVCGKVMLCYPKMPRKYCSESCQHRSPEFIKTSKTMWLLSNTPERKRKTIERLTSLVGEKNPMWKGGVTPKHRAVRTSSKYSEWRRLVFERDNYRCVECHRRNGNGETVYLEADHIVPFSKILKEENWDLMWNIGNGRTLCRECHRKTTNYRK